MTTPESNPAGPSRKQSVWGDLQNPRVIWAKGILFVLLGCLSAGVLIARSADLTEVALLCVSIWAFCRAYYFAFYVIEHYVDPGFRFDGLISFLKYAFAKSRSKKQRKDGTRD